MRADVVGSVDVYGVKRTFTCMCRVTSPRTWAEDHRASVTHERMNRGREGSDKQRSEDMDSAWWTNSYCSSFDTRAGPSRDDGCYICVLCP